MVLVDRHIKQQLDKGNIIIDPFNPDNLGPNSYDMTLAPVCKVYHPAAIGQNSIGYMADHRASFMELYKEYGAGNWHLDPKKDNPNFEFSIPKSGFVLQPNHLYLYACNESIGVGKDICATVMGKSSLGRLGLDIHVCAGFIDTGFGVSEKSSLVLEMRTIYPLKIYPGMKICQVRFDHTSGEPDVPYNKNKGSKYNGQQGVVASRYAQNFKNMQKV